MSLQKIDVNFINPFIGGAIETLKVQCSFTARAGRPFLKGKGPNIVTDFAAVIGLKSSTFSGSVALCFPKQVFLSIMERMLGKKCTEITPELEDGASELLNTIFGQAKRILDGKGYQIENAVPTIIREDGIKMDSDSTVVLPFETDLGTFHILITTEPEKN